MFYYENKPLPVEAEMRYSDLGCPYHFHRHVEIVAVLDGNAVAVVDSQRYEMTAGDLCVVFPHQIHAYENRGAATSAVLLFLPEICTEFLSLFTHCHPIQPLVHDTRQRIIRHLRTLTDLQHDDTMFVNAQQHAHILLLLSGLLPHLEVEDAAACSPSLLQNLTRYCQDHFREPLTLDDLAQHLHVSRYHLSHLINKNLHMNFNEYLASLRIDEACHQLTDDNARVSEVALACGFNSIRSFNRHFTQITGVSPKQWREQNHPLYRRLSSS